MEHKKLIELENLVEDGLRESLESILGSISDFLDLDFSYDYSIDSYEKKDSTREILKVKLQPEHSDSLLIGYHGKSLQRLERLITVSLSNRYSQIVRVSLDINDYKAKRQRTLENMADDALHEVEQTASDVELEPMNPSDRRIIHEYLSTHENVTTESIGEGRERHIVIKPSENVGTDPQAEELDRIEKFEESI